MWTRLVFLAIVGLVAGQSPWKPNQEYTYNIYARTLTALPDLKDQYVGVVMQGKLVLQPKSNDRIIGKLLKISHAHFHDDLEGGWNAQIPEQGLSFQESQLSNKQFVLHTKNGVIRSVGVDQSMTNDEANQLKAILSQLQIDIKGEQLIKSKHNQLPENTENPNALYKTMEASITGQCETLYDIEPLPEYAVKQTYPEWAPETEIKLDRNAFQIMKTLNYSNCDVRKGFHFGLTGDSDFKPNTNQMGDLLSKSSVTRVVATGTPNDFTIQYAYTTNRVAVSPGLYQNEKAQVISQIVLALEKIQDGSQQMQEIQQLVNAGNLVYRYNLPSDKENKVREGHQEDESFGQDETRGILNIIQTTNLRTRRDITGRKYGKKIQSSGNIRNQGGNSDSSSSSSSSEETLKYPNNQLQPQPNMQQAPETPLYHFTVGNKGRSIKHDNKVNVEGEARKLAEEISHDLQNQDEISKRNTLEKFDILCDLIRIMDQQQIINVAQTLRIGNRQAGALSESLAAQTFRDAVAQAGTGPAVAVVAKWISDQKVKGYEAADLLNTLSTSVRTPTPEVIKTLFNLVKSEQVKSQSELHANALISLTDLVRRAATSKKSGRNFYPVETFGPFHVQLEEMITKELIPYVGQRLHDSVQQNNAQKTLLYVRALGNIGHPDIVGVYEKYLEGEGQMSQFQRTAMVLSLDKLTRNYPSLARRVLYKIYANVAEAPQTRAVAVYLLMRTGPPAAMLQRMAEYTNEDPSDAVQAIVKSVIESAAELNSDDNAYLAANAQAALQFLNPREYGNQYSKAYIRDYVAQGLNAIYEHQLGHILGENGVYPEAILYKAYKNYGGYVAKDVEVQALISSVEDLMGLLPQTDDSGEERNEKQGGNQWSSERISKMLNLKSEEAEQLEGQILLNIMGRQRFFSFDEKTLQDLPRKLASIAPIFMGEKLDFNKLYNRRQIIVAFPLATGYPFVYTFNNPTLMHAVGEVHAKTQPDFTQSPSWEVIRNTEAVNITANVHLVFSSVQIGKTGFITPFEGQRYVAGHVRKMQAHIPLNAKVDVDIKNRQITGKVAAIENNKDFIAYHASAWPFTLRKDAADLRPFAEAKDLKVIKSRPTHQFDRTIGEKSIGMALRMQIEHELSESTWRRMEMTVRHQGILSLTSLPVSYYTTIQKILNKRMFSPESFMPYSFQRRDHSLSEKEAILSLAILPFAEELTSEEIIKAQGFLSIMTLPFADIYTLEKTANLQSIVGVGEPASPIRSLDHYNLNVKYDAGRSVNRIIKFNLKFDRAYNVNEEGKDISQRVSGPASADEGKLAYASNTEPDSAERRRQFYDNVGYDMKKASVVIFDAALIFDGESRAEYVATFAHGQSGTSDRRRVLAFLSAKHAKRSAAKQMCITYTGKQENTPALNLEEVWKHDAKSNARLQIAIGEKCQSSSSRINMNIVSAKSQEYMEYLSQQAHSGMDCEEAKKKGTEQTRACFRSRLGAIYNATIPNYIKVTADIENATPQMKNASHKALEILRQIGFWNLDEDINKKGTPNRVEAEIHIAPTLEHMEAYIRTEDMELAFRDLEINDLLKPLVSMYQGVHPQRNIMGRIQNEERACEMSKDTIFTFDDNIMQQQIGKCWYVMLHQTHPKSRISGMNGHLRNISVLVRESEQSGKKEAMITIMGRQGSQIVQLVPTGSSVRVIVNGQEKKISQEEAINIGDGTGSSWRKSLMKIYELPSGEVRIDINEGDMKLYMNSEKIRIDAGPQYRNNVNGLCGNYNGERMDDTVTPQKCVLMNEKLFASSWALTDERCSSEVQQMKMKVQQGTCYSIKKLFGRNIINDWEAGRHYQENDTKQWKSNWFSESDSSSSSSSSSEEKRTGSGIEKGQSTTGGRRGSYENRCDLGEQIQYVELNGRTCFSTLPLPACPSRCQTGRKEQRQVPVYCRDSNDSLSRLYKQQIQKGDNPDLSSKKANRNLKFNVPTTCIPVY